MWEVMVDENKARVAHWWCRNIFIGFERTVFALIPDYTGPIFHLRIVDGLGVWRHSMSMEPRELPLVYQLEKKHYLDTRDICPETELEQFRFSLIGEHWEDLDWLFGPLMYAFCALNMDVTLSYSDISKYYPIPQWFNFGVQLKWDVSRHMWVGVLNFSTFYLAFSTSTFFCPLYQKITERVVARDSPWSILFETPISIIRERYQAQSPLSQPYVNLLPASDVKYLFDCFIRHSLRMSMPNKCMPIYMFVECISLSSLALYETDHSPIDYFNCGAVHVNVMEKCYNLTPVQLAICFNNEALLKYLIIDRGGGAKAANQYFCKHECFMEHFDERCRTRIASVSALELAIVLDRYNLALLLLKHGARVDTQNNVPLFHRLLSSGGSSEEVLAVAREMLKSGGSSSLLRVDDNGNTVIHTLFENLNCYDNIYERITWILSAVSKSEAAWILSRVNHLDETVLQLFLTNVRHLCMAPHLELAERILELMLTHLSSSPSKHAILNHCSPGEHDHVLIHLSRDTQFFGATRVAFTKMLLHHGARVSVMPWDSDPPELITLYLDSGHDPMFANPEKPLEGYAAFFECAAYGTRAAFANFLAHPNVNVNARNYLGWTVLFFLVRHALKMLFLLDDKNARDLIYRIRMVLEAGANVDMDCCPMLEPFDRLMPTCTPLALVEARMRKEKELLIQLCRGNRKRNRVNHDLDGPMSMYVAEIHALLNR
jgi:ankyrin repeat protein